MVISNILKQNVSSIFISELNPICDPVSLQFTCVCTDMPFRIFVLFVLWLTPFISKAQLFGDSYEPGTIVTKSGDTLVGYMKKRGSGLLYKTNVRTSEQSKIKYPDVVYFVMDDNKYVYFNAVYKVVKEGKKIGLYSREGPGTVSMGAPGTAMSSTKGGTYLYFKRTSETKLTVIRSPGAINFNGSFKKIAKEYFSDCPNLQRQIAQENFEKQQLEEIIDYYESYCSN